MPLSLNLLPTSRPTTPYEIYDDSSDDDLHTSQQQYLLPPLPTVSATSSAISSANNSPLPSRSSSPIPPPVYHSTSDDEPSSPFLSPGYSSSSGRRRRWWLQRRKRDATWRSWKRTLQRVVRHPLFPAQPLSILLALLLFTTFAILLTLFLIYILNPDKYPLPWRQYCYETPQFPPPPGSNPNYNFTALPSAGVYLGVFSMDAAVERRMLIRTTWASHRASRGTDGSTDRTIVRFILGKPRKEWERRIKLEMETYNDIVILPIAENMNNGKSHAYFTWAHQNAFVPPPVRAVAPEVPTLSPPTIPEEDSHANFEPSAKPTAISLDDPASEHLATFPSPSRLAPHDPRPRYPSSSRPQHSIHGPKCGSLQRLGHSSGHPEEQPQWVKPDFVFKADDDSFVMLTELEGRLRVELAEARLASRLDGKPDEIRDPLIFWGYLVKNRFMAGELYGLSRALVEYVATTASLRSMTRGAEDKQTAKWIRLHPQAERVRWRSEHCWIYDHPRAGTVYSHGFLFPSEWRRVKEQVQRWSEKKTYASSSLPYYDSSSSEDTEPSPPSSPEAPESEHAAPTSENTSPSTNPDSTPPSSSSPSADEPDTHPWRSPAWHLGAPDPSIPPPPISPFLSHTSVSRFGTRYTPPVKFTNLTAMMEVEALVEGSLMSKLRRDESSPGSSIWEELRWEDVWRAWVERESWKQRYFVPETTTEEESNDQDKSVQGALGGTVCVHFIKKNEWYMEAVLAFLGGSSIMGQRTIAEPQT